jgi:hypothetical protein
MHAVKQEEQDIIHIYILLCVDDAVLSRDYGVTGDVSEALQRTVWAATYVVRKPLDAGELSRLWKVIKWSKFLLRRAWPEWPRGSRVRPAVVGALLPGSSTVDGRWEDDDDDGREHFRAVRAGRGRRRKLGDRQYHGGRSSGRGGGGGVAGPFGSKPLYILVLMLMKLPHN